MRVVLLQNAPGIGIQFMLELDDDGPCDDDCVEAAITKLTEAGIEAVDPLDGAVRLTLSIAYMKDHQLPDGDVEPARAHLASLFS